VPEGRTIFPKLTVEEDLERSGHRVKGKCRNKMNKERFYELFPRLKEGIK